MLPYRIFRTARLLHYSTPSLPIMVLFLVGLIACADVTPTPIVIPSPILTPVVAPTEVATQLTPTSALTITPTLAPVAPPERLIEPDTERPLVGFGPPAPSGQWLLTQRQFDQPLFVVHRLLGDQPEVMSFGLGTPLGWSNDGALIIWRPNDQPQTLLGLEPTTGMTMTVLSTERGPVDGFAWLRNEVLYSIQGTDALELGKLNQSNTEAIVARLPERTLLPNGLLAAPDGLSAALVVTSTTTISSELYLFDPAIGELRLIDSARGKPDARALWATDGLLYYDLGAGLRRYDLQLGLITEAAVEALPLTWTPQGLLLQQRETHALIRWRTDGNIEPFNTNGTPVTIKAAQFFGGSQVLFLINGEVWRSELP